MRVRSERPSQISDSHAQRAMQSDPRLNALLRPVECDWPGVPESPIGLNAAGITSDSQKINEAVVSRPLTIGLHRHSAVSERSDRVGLTLRPLPDCICA